MKHHRLVRHGPPHTSPLVPPGPPCQGGGWAGAQPTASYFIAWPADSGMLGRALVQPRLGTRTLSQASYGLPPTDVHLTHRGNRSDTTGSSVPTEMLFFHGAEYSKTSYATLNELTIGQAGDEKRSISAVLADPSPAGRPSTFKVSG